MHKKQITWRKEGSSALMENYCIPPKIEKSTWEIVGDPVCESWERAHSSGVPLAEYKNIYSGALSQQGAGRVGGIGVFPEREESLVVFDGFGCVA
jgi:hypothetical protein